MDDAKSIASDAARDELQSNPSQLVGGEEVERFLDNPTRPVLRQAQDVPPSPQGGGESAGAFMLPPSLALPRKGGGERVEDEVRRHYELGAESVPKLCERFGLTLSQLRKMREAGNWTPRRAVARPGPLQGHKPVGEEAVDYRLNRLVAIGITMLEQKIADEGMTETNARTLKELCRAQETRMRATRNEKAAKAREKKNNDAGDDFRDDPNWIRAEFARRLDLVFGPADSERSVLHVAAGGTAEVSGDLAKPL